VVLRSERAICSASATCRRKAIKADILCSSRSAGTMRSRGFLVVTVAVDILLMNYPPARGANDYLTRPEQSPVNFVRKAKDFFAFLFSPSNVSQGNVPGREPDIGSAFDERRLTAYAVRNRGGGKLYGCPLDRTQCSKSTLSKGLWCAI
jgi:hypothetical protein